MIPPTLVRRIVERLLRTVIPSDECEQAVGDLDQRLADRLGRPGSRNPLLWYTKQAVSLLVWGASERMRRSVGGTLDALRHGLVTDLRFGFRSLRRNPGFTVVAVATLALGIGGNTAVFSVVDGVLLRPLPFSASDQLVAIHETRAGQTWWSAAPVNALAWRERSRTLQDVAWGQARRMSLLSGSGAAAEPEAVQAVAVSANLFDLLDVQPVVGRFFRAADDQVGAEAVVVLTHESWAQRFASDPALLGERLILDGVPHTVIGIVPEGQAPNFFSPHDLLIPRILTEAEATPGSNRGRGRILQAIGRLQDDVEFPAAAAEMAALATQLDAEAPGGSARGWSAQLVPLKTQVIGTARTPLLVLLGAVGLVLLVACVNLGNLMLARGTARGSELAVRASLGAGRGRLVRYVALEAVLITVMGGVAGVALSLWGTDLLLRVDPSALPRITEVEADRTILWFTGALCGVSALLFGLAPALHLSRIDLAQAYQGRGTAAGHARKDVRIRSGLVASQVTLVVVLLVGAGITLRGLSALTRVDPGFQVEGRYAAQLTLPGTRYPDGPTIAQFVSALSREVQAIPGVLAAGTVTTLPLRGGPGFTAFQVPRSMPTPEPGSEPIGGMEIVSPGYFEAMGIPVTRGRPFRESDMSDALPVTIVNEEAVARLWPNADPLTDAVRMAPAGAGQIATWRPVVGTVGSVRYGLDAEPRPRLYLPEGQSAFTGSRTLVLHVGRGAQSSIGSLVRDALKRVDPLLSVERFERIEDVAETSIARTRFQTTLFTIFAAVALGLGAVGVYGVVAFMVAQRKGEVGVRLALGAQPGSVVRLMIREALRPVWVGLALGLILAAGLSSMLASVTYGTRVLDPVTFGAAPVLLLVVAVVAAFFPSRRASRISPVRTLRAD